MELNDLLRGLSTTSRIHQACCCSQSNLIESLKKNEMSLHRMQSNACAYTTWKLNTILQNWYEYCIIKVHSNLGMVVCIK